MANELTSNPLIVDTAGALIVTQYIKIQKIRLVGPVITKTYTLKDRTGKVRWKFVMGSGNTPTEPLVVPDSDFTLEPLKMDGLTVEDISSGGELHIYLTETNIPVKTT